MLIAFAICRRALHASKKTATSPQRISASGYIDRRAITQTGLTESDYRMQYEKELKTSTTLYVGNLSHWTMETQLWDYFSRYGEVDDIIMGLNRETKEPSGFCFVVMATREDAEIVYDALRTGHDLLENNESVREEIWAAGMPWDLLWEISSHPPILDDRPIRVDFDRGKAIREEGRYWGRGWTGGQVRDEYRRTIDMGRGGANARENWKSELKDPETLEIRELGGSRKRMREAESDETEATSSSGGDTSEISEDEDDLVNELNENRREDKRSVYHWMSFSIDQWRYRRRMTDFNLT